MIIPPVSKREKHATDVREARREYQTIGGLIEPSFESTIQPSQVLATARRWDSPVLGRLTVAIDVFPLEEQGWVTLEMLWKRRGSSHGRQQIKIDIHNVRHCPKF